MSNARSVKGPVFIQELKMKQPRIIAGSGRSGTTWVLDTIANTSRLRTIFEPLHPVVIPRARPYAYRYVPENLDMPDLKDFLKRVFDGSFHSLWSDFRVRPDRLWPTINTFCSMDDAVMLYRRWKKLYEHYHLYQKTLSYPHIIMKCVRANLMLSWIRKNFDAKIVFLLRHPGAVVESQLRHGKEHWDPYMVLNIYRKDPHLWQDYLSQYARLLNRKLSPAQALTVNWCIENQIPLQNADQGKYMVVFYERLLTEPVQEWTQIMQALQLTQMPDMEDVRQPSQQASMHWRGSNFEKNSYQQWLGLIGKDTLEEVNSVLLEMEVQVYDAYDPLPRDGEVNV